MNFLIKRLLPCFITTITLSNIPQVKLVQQKINLKALQQNNNPLLAIEQKYESNTINVGTINYQNYWSDLNQSNFGKLLHAKMIVNFQISKTNHSANNFIWYNGKHGTDMASTYESKIESDSIKIITSVAMLAIVVDVAQYYGDNPTINQYLKIAAITKDLYLVQTINQNLPSNLLLNGGESFGDNMYEWAQNINNIINHVISKNYTDQLMHNFNQLDFSNMQVANNNLHYCDDTMDNLPDNQYYFTINDWFKFGPFMIVMDNHFSFTIKDLIVDQLREFSYSDPNDYDLHF